jgi:hypothetical protein
MNIGSRGGVQVVDCLPSNHKALNSNPGTAKKKKKERKKKVSRRVFIKWKWESATNQVF